MRARSRFVELLIEPLGFEMRNERIDQRPDLSVHAFGELMQREVDAMVGDTILREIVRANFFGAIAGFNLALSLCSEGGVLFLLPICVILVYFTWPWFVESWRIDETSSNAGGLIRWPVKLILPVGFTLMALQGVSELIKRVEALIHHHRLQFEYEKPLQ